MGEGGGGGGCNWQTLSKDQECMEKNNGIYYLRFALRRKNWLYSDPGCAHRVML